MHIEFLDQSTVIIKKSLFWDGLRPEKKIIIKKHIIIKEFEEKYKDFKVETVSGPDSVNNFRMAKDAEATWYLKVEKTKASTKPKAPLEIKETEKLPTPSRRPRHSKIRTKETKEV